MYLMMFLKWKVQFHASFVKKVQQQSELFYGTTRAKKKLQKESWIDKLMNQFSGSEVSNKKKVPLPSAFKIFPQKFPTASNLHGRTKKPRAPRSGCLDLRPFETSLGVQWPRQSAVALPPHPHGSAVRWLLKGSSEGRWVVEVSASEGDFVSCKMSLQNGGFFFGGGGGWARTQTLVIRFAYIFESHTPKRCTVLKSYMIEMMMMMMIMIQSLRDARLPSSHWVLYHQNLWVSQWTRAALQAFAGGKPSNAAVPRSAVATLRPWQNRKIGGWGERSSDVGVMFLCDSVTDDASENLLISYND